MRKKQKFEKGITLVSLIITIVIMLILAAVAINLIIGKNGLFIKAKDSVTIYEKNRIQEKLQLAATNGYTDEAVKDITESDVADSMKQEIPDIDWVDKESLAGHYSGYDFTVIDRVVVMDTIQISTKNMNLMKNSSNYGSSNVAFWKYKSNIKNITFNIDKDLSKYTSNAVNDNNPWDVSDSGNGSILSYLEVIPTDSSYYNLYIVSDKTVRFPVDSSYLFDYFQYVESFNNLQNISTVKVENMYSMFNNFGTANLKTLNLGSNFNTSDVTNMESMFNMCGDQNLETLNLGSNFDTSNVIKMNNMFQNCASKKLKSFSLGNKFNTGKVETMYGMFENFGEYSLENLDLGSNFDTSNVTDFRYMFEYCAAYSNITSLDLGDKFNTSKGQYFDGMFTYFAYEAPQFTKLDLGENFDTSHASSFDSMFNYCGTVSLDKLELGKKFTFDSNNRYINLSGIVNNAGKENCAIYALQTTIDKIESYGTNITNFIAYEE